MDPKSRNIHDTSIVIDCLEVSKWGEETFQNMRAGGLTAVNCTVSILENFRQTIGNISWWYEALDSYSDLIMPVMTTGDVLEAKKAGKTGIIFGFQNTTAVEDDLGLLAIFHRLGVRVVQLCYMEGNLAGQGCLERIDAGLTRFGVEMIEEMNRLGMLIDLSHVGHRTTMEAIKASQKPVVFTHANPRSLCDHPRNKQDEAIKALVEKGGVIGATVFPPFLPGGDQPTLDGFVDVIDYLVDLAGIDHVAVGSDFTEGQPKAFFDWILTGRSRKGPAFALDYPVKNPRGIQGPADFPNITEALAGRGYSERHIRKILGGNIMRLFHEVWNE